MMTTKPAPKRRKVTRSFEDAHVYDEHGNNIGRPSRTLYEEARRTMLPVWARPTEVKEGMWGTFPPHVPHTADPEARLVRVA